MYSQKGALLATHKIPKRKGLTVIEKKHYEGLRKKIPRSKALLERLFLDTFPGQQTFLDRLLVQQKANASHHIGVILQLGSIYRREDMQRAFSLSLEYNCFSANFIKGILHSEGDIEELSCSGICSLHHLPEVNIRRGLAFYQRLIP